jgi:hypothetical protein
MQIISYFLLIDSVETIMEESILPVVKYIKLRNVAFLFKSEAYRFNNNGVLNYIFC